MILNLCTGQQLTVEQALAEMNGRSVGQCQEMEPELQHADGLVAQLLERIEDLEDEVDATKRLLAAERYCREQDRLAREA